MEPYEATRSATYKAVKAKLRSNLGGPGVRGSFRHVGPIGTREWDSILYAAFTRVASPVVHSEVLHAFRYSMFAGVEKALEESSVPTEEWNRIREDVIRDCSWAPRTLPVPTTEPDALKEHLGALFEELATAKPAFVRADTIQEVAQVVRTERIDPCAMVDHPIALFFERPILGRPEIRSEDPGWQTLQDAARAVVRGLPVHSKSDLPDTIDFVGIEPHVLGVIVSKGEDGRIRPSTTCLMSPRAVATDQSRHRISGVSSPDCVVPVRIPLPDSTLSSLVYGLTRSAIETSARRGKGADLDILTVELGKTPSKPNERPSLES